MSADRGVRLSIGDGAGSTPRSAGSCNWALVDHAPSKNGASTGSTCSIPKVTSSTCNRQDTMATSVQIVFDCSEPDALATFWAGALHYKKQDPPTGFASWEDFLRAQGIPESLWNSAS